MWSKRIVRRAATITALIAVAAPLAACGKSTSSSNTTTTAAPSSSQSGAASAEVAAAQKIVDKAAEKPTTIALTEPLPQAPPKDKTFVWLACDIPSCTYIGNGIKAAVTAAGWKYQQINYQSANPATLTEAFKHALTMNPTVVGESGVPPAAGWVSVVPDYKAAGIPIITSYLGSTETNDTIIANVAGPPVFADYARIIAAWFVANSNASGKALVQRVDAFPILKYFSDELVKDIKDGCANCNVDTVLANSAADAGSNKIVPTVVSALKRDPSLKYLLSCDLEFLDALPSAMSTAGIKDVKVLGQSPSVASLGYVKAGKWPMVPSHPLDQVGWVMADVAFRHVMKLPIPAEDLGPQPSWLLTPTTDFDSTKLVDYPEDYPAQFKKLWHIG